MEASAAELKNPNVSFFELFLLARRSIDLCDLVSGQRKFGSSDGLLRLLLVPYSDDDASDRLVCELPGNDNIDHASVVGSSDPLESLADPLDFGLVFWLGVEVVSSKVLRVKLVKVEVVGQESFSE